MDFSRASLHDMDTYGDTTDARFSQLYSVAIRMAMALVLRVRRNRSNSRQSDLPGTASVQKAPIRQVALKTLRTNPSGGIEYRFLGACSHGSILSTRLTMSRICCCCRGTRSAWRRVIESDLFVKA